jgi:dethiobiotin synthetase
MAKGTTVVFITGTDTGVGKTMATALLLCYLRNNGCPAMAIKPFCSGGRADAELMWKLQERQLTLEEINPFYFPEPIAPLVSARLHKRQIPLDRVVRHIQAIASRVETSYANSKIKTRIVNSKLKPQNYLLIEGSGGLLVPLGERYTVADLIAALDCKVIVVSRNKLGTINHTLLTLQALLAVTSRRSRGSSHASGKSVRCLLMDCHPRDLSGRSNGKILEELIHPVPLICLPFLGKNCDSAPLVRKNAKKFQKTLAHLFL